MPKASLTSPALKVRVEVQFSASLPMTTQNEFKKNILNVLQIKKVITETLGACAKTPEYLKTFKVLNCSPVVEVMLCDDQLMREFQRSYRNLDRTTDVLSFPMSERVEPGEKIESWGELIVSVETVQRHAKSYKRPARHEMVEVLVHGTMHLLGFDHVGNSSLARRRAQQMKALQRELSSRILRII